ncbi:sodium:proton antiporter [Anaerosolibacter sp.]|uniref:sodium:proton antiporter n=1 Tax=Anaerosolibacter sp. TaxID=1872527 RepID=UPI0039EF6CC5
MNIHPVFSFILFLIGMYGMTVSKNIIKTIICLQLTEASVVLLYLSLASEVNGTIPILPGSQDLFVDPLPQALMITTIVIGSAITALALMLSIKLFHYYGTLDWKELLKREG